MNQSILGREWAVPYPPVRVSWLWPAGVVVLGAALRLYRLDAWNLETDEGFSANAAALTLRAIPAFVARWDSHPPLFYLILHFWRWLGADTEFTLRLLPVSFGILSIVILYRLTAYLLGPKTALLASLLLAISPYHIWFSQMLRSYPAVFFFALLSLDAMARLLREERAALWVFYVGATTLALYTDYAAVLVWVAQNVAVAVLGLRRSAPPWWKWMLAQAAILLLFLPWLGLRPWEGLRLGAAPDALAPLTGSAGGAASASLSAVSSVVYALAAFTSAFLPMREPWIKVAVVLVFGSAWILGLWAVRRRLGPAVLLASVTLIPIGAGILGAYALKGFLPAMFHVIPTRTLIVAGAGYYPLLAAGFRRGLSRRAGVLWLAALVMVNLYSLDLMYFHTAKSEPWRQIAAAVAAQIRPGDAVVFAPGYWHRPFDFYYHGPGAIAECYDDDPGRLMACASRHGSFYLVFGKWEDGAAWRQIPGHARSTRSEFGDVVVERYSRL